MYYYLGYCNQSPYSTYLSNNPATYPPMHLFLLNTEQSDGPFPIRSYGLDLNLEVTNYLSRVDVAGDFCERKKKINK